MSLAEQFNGVKKPLWRLFDLGNLFELNFDLVVPRSRELYI